MLNKGYIEGFYGRLMSLQDRTLILNKLSELSMDFYIYGPKEDPFHRSSWSSIYPEDKAEDLQKFKEVGEKLGIKTYMALSPLISPKDNLKEGIKSIDKKIKQFKDIGFKDFAIFFDDVDFERNEILAKTHSDILNSVSDSINQDNQDSLIFCPTVYCNRFAKGELKDSPYLKALSKEVPETIPMLWTGKEVVSKTINDVDILSLKQIIKNPIIIWDNYYANDYCPRKLFIGDYQGRDFSENSPMGIGINPTGLPITDSIILSQVEGSRSTKDILRKNNVPDCFEKILPFFNGPFNKVPALEGLENIKSLLKLSTPLCIDWKSELQLEWAPYLWNFFIDLNFLMKLYKSEDQKGLEEWASQRYSNPLNEIIFRRNTDN
jgi:hypothetical protein